MLDYVFQSPNWYLLNSSYQKSSHEADGATPHNPEFKVVKELFDYLYDLVGPSRLMFASNYPVSKPGYLSDNVSKNNTADDTTLEHLYMNGFLRSCQDKVCTV